MVACPIYKLEGFTMYNFVVCRYHEIATKGNNRHIFERCLVDNIHHALRDVPNLKVQRVSGRVWIERKDGAVFSAEEIARFHESLPKVFGLASYSIAIKIAPNMDAIHEAVKQAVPVAFEKMPTDRKFSFRIRARRSNKEFPLDSKGIEIDIITLIGQMYGNDYFKIDLQNADLTLNCEVRHEYAALFWEIFPGPGGLPVGSNPRVLTLISGGIDSPVAAYMIMKRGSATDFITFHSSPYTPPETTAKVERIVKHMNTFQVQGKLHLVNLAEFQKLVRDNCQERFRTVLYRRAMYRIAEIVALRTKCKALVTGEALGQVASQTVVNMDTTNRAINMLVLRPLIGEDKLETIAVAEKIGTMELSAPQVPDSCTVFAPASPATSAPVDIIEKEELKIPNYTQVLLQIVDEIEIIA